MTKCNTCTFELLISDVERCPKCNILLIKVLTHHGKPEYSAKGSYKITKMLKRNLYKPAEEATDTQPVTARGKTKQEALAKLDTLILRGETDPDFDPYIVN